jgi:hypothetical protein
MALELLSGEERTHQNNRITEGKHRCTREMNYKWNRKLWIISFPTGTPTTSAAFDSNN